MIQQNLHEKLTETEREFFNNLQRFINRKLYFYGSINRMDYYTGQSDIDVDIFTDNVKSTLTRLQQFLSISYSKIKKTIVIIDNKHVSGHKISYKYYNSDNVCLFRTELNIYNTTDKDIILTKFHTDLSFFPLIPILILKILFYDLQILPKETFKYLKDAYVEIWKTLKIQYFSFKDV